MCLQEHSRPAPQRRPYSRLLPARMKRACSIHQSNILEYKFELAQAAFYAMCPNAAPTLTVEGKTILPTMIPGWIESRVNASLGAVTTQTVTQCGACTPGSPRATP